MSGDIEAHLLRDEQLRKTMLQQENVVMSPDEDLPVLLKEQIARELKDPKMQQEFKSGPEGKQKVIEHFRSMGSQIDRLYHLKELEKRVIEKEKRIARGEEVADDLNDEAEDLPFDPRSAHARAMLEPDPTSNDPADLIESEYRKYNAYRDTYTQAFETVDASAPDALDALAMRSNVEQASFEIRSSPSQRASSASATAKRTSQSSSPSSFERMSEPVLVPRTVLEPCKEEGLQDETALEDSELPPWPTVEEVAAAEAELVLPDTHVTEDDLSPQSHYIRSERMRRQHEQEQYKEEMVDSPIPPLPFIYRQFIATQLKLGLPVPDRFVLPFVPPGMTPQEFLIEEDLMSESGNTLEISGKEIEAQEPVMVDTEASIPKVEGSCCTSLRQAVEKRHFGCLSVLCDPTHGLAPTGETPLHVAAILEDLECAKELIDRKIVDVNAVASISRSSALHSACVRGDMNIVKFLVQRGAKINHADCDGLTALHLAVAAGASTSLVNYLIDQKANLLLGDNQGAIALHIAADGGNTAMVKLLLGKGSPINNVTGDRETPLFLACEQGHLDVVELLLANGADANLANVTGSTPLHAAAKRGAVGVVKALLKAGVNAFVNDAGQNTPLHVAAVEGNVEIARHLIAAGCPIAATTAEGWTALHISAQVGSKEMAELLLEVGSSIHARNDEGSTVLHIALSANQSAIIPFLIEKGADVNVGDMNNVTPLLLAIQEGNEEIAELLLQKGARTNTLTSDSVTPLHMALEEGMYSLAQRMISQGSSPVQETLEGFQPIHIVAARGNSEWVQKLIDLGANPNALTQAGLTPLRIAQENGFTDIEALLRKNGARELDIFAWMELEAAAKAKREALNSPNSASL
jgi:ankyrin repeat protein